ncbi:MAG TPA: metallophosphoesterase [Pyrinomonadaceae bacterium]|nr:metallophosphoesterase [Pyrinomonadaceae bacterium]
MTGIFGASTAALLFFLFVVSVYLFAALALVRMALRRAGWLEAPSRPIGLAERASLVLASLGVVCILYGYFVEPYWPEVTRVRVESTKLAGAARPVRLVHISDLHCDPRPRLEERLPEIIAAERPDLIVFTGDSLNSPAGLPVFRKLMTSLARIAPTYAARGNWDAWYWRDIDLFGGTGVTELKGGASELKVAGTSVWVAGAPYASLHEPMRPGVEGDTPFRLLDGVPPGAFTVLLYHTPDEILEVAETRKVDLYCAGHTHGGQVALPVYGALVTLSKFGKRYESGLHREGDTRLYVTRGVGMEGGPAPRVRFFARPEVTVIELAPK